MCETVYFLLLTLLPGRDPITNYLIGDTAYPLTPYSMKKIPGLL